MANVQDRNSELPGNLSQDFVSKKDAVSALNSAITFPLSFFIIRGFWPMNVFTTTGTIKDTTNTGLDLTFTGNAGVNPENAFSTMSYYNGAGHATPATPGNLLTTGPLTFGGWIDVRAGSASSVGIMGRYRDDGANECSYSLYMTGGTNIVALVNGTGNPANNVTVTYPNYPGFDYRRVVVRYTPSVELAIFINGRKAVSNTVGIPATLYAGGTHPFRFGSFNNTPLYWTGHISYPFVSFWALDDAVIFADFESTRSLYGK
jgi:hypothetical protein